VKNSKEAAYLIEWVEGGRVVRTTTASEFPVTQLFSNEGKQRLAAMVLGHTFQDALDRLMRMVDAVDPKLAAKLRKEI